MRLRRIALYAALCLCVPVPALALSGKDSAPAPSELEVSVSLDHCGLLDTQILCKLDVTFTALPGAVRHTATVTRPDGSAVEFGALGPGVGSMWVPYAGDGTYVVDVSAYGAATHPKGSATLLERERAVAGTAGPAARGGGGSAARGDDEPDQEAESPDGDVDEDTGADGDEQEGEPPAPTCSEEQIAAAEEAIAGLSSEQIAALEAEGMLPEGFHCLDVAALLAPAP